jgi:tetratricopeptide (TPR) repeat protein
MEHAARVAVDLAKGGDVWPEAVAHAALGGALLQSGRLSEATTEATASLTLFRSIGDRTMIFEALTELVMIAELEQRFDDAITLLEEVAAVAHDGGIAEYRQWALSRLGFFRTLLGDPAAGDACHKESLDIGSSIWANATAHLGRAICARAVGDLASAGEHLAAAFSIHERYGIQVELAYLRAFSGWLALDAGDPLGARSHAEASLELASVAGDVGAVAMATEVLAAAALHEGDDRSATQLLADASTLVNVVGHPMWLLTRPDVAALDAATSRSS